MFLNILNGVGLTLWVTGASLVIGGLIAFPLVIGARSRFTVVRAVASGYINIVRVIPPITWLFLIYFGLPQYSFKITTVQAAILGFSIIASAFMAEIYRSGLLAIPVGQREAATALGMSPWSTAMHIVTPQAWRVALPPVATYAIGLLKDSALASTIGVQEITYFAQQTARQTYQGLLSFAIAGLLYIAISLVVALIARRVDITVRRKVGTI